MKPSKTFITTLLALFFLVSFDSVRNYYMTATPIGKTNSCYSIHYPDFKQHYQMKIIINNYLTQESTVEIEPDNKRWVDTETYTYRELRLLEPKKMECK